MLPSAASSVSWEENMWLTLERSGVLALGLCVALGACKARERTERAAETASAPGAMATPSDTAHMGGNAPTAPTPSWTEGEILAFTTEANRGEIAEGYLAEHKATGRTVKDFAREMVKVHQKLLNEGTSFREKNHVTLDTTHEEVSERMKESHKDLQELNEKKAGKDWDREFLENQVNDHEEMLEQLQKAEQSTSNPALKELLTKQSGDVQMLLTKAKDLKEKKAES
jgi:putative membrane protein